MIPPNIAALFSPTVVSVKLEHGGGACPVTTGELHPSGGNDIKLRQEIHVQLLSALSLSHYEEWVGSKDEATHY